MKSIDSKSINLKFISSKPQKPSIFYKIFSPFLRLGKVIPENFSNNFGNVIEFREEDNNFSFIVVISIDYRIEMQYM